jgi:DNA uptake protein ComE-like DNA-binding protein
MLKLRPIALAILAAAVTLAGAQPFAPQRPRPTPSPQPASATVPTGDPLDINTATPQQLNALPGFGPAYTRRVIAGRPYTAKNQLVTRGVLPQGAYERISAQIVAHRPAR